MKIVLRDDVDNLGRKGDLVEVADGYARNFLLPRGFAMKATKGVARQAEEMQRSRAARDQRDKAGAEELAGKLTGAKIEITARAGEGGKLFGSVTNADVAEAIQRVTGVEVDRRSIDMDEPFKELGPHELPVKLHPEVTVPVTVEVVAEAV